MTSKFVSRAGILSVIVLAVVSLAPAPAEAGGPGCWGGPWGGPWGWGGGWGPRYCSPAAFWTGFGLTTGAMVLGAASAYYPPPATVYYAPSPVYSPVVYQSAPTVVYQQPAPQIVYQQAAPQVVYQQAPQQQVVLQQPPAQAQQPVQTVQAQPVQQQLVAQAPAQQEQAPAVQQVSNVDPFKITGQYDVYLPNGNGTFTMVRLSKTPTGYLGPQGEYYPDHPTTEQLNARYLKK